MKNKPIPVVENYQPYPTPKNCLYKRPTDQYDINAGGWINAPTQCQVIGETDDCYIEELRPIPETFNEKRIKYLLPLGFHKSRLIQWLPTQLQMFA